MVQALNKMGARSSIGWIRPKVAGSSPPRHLCISIRIPDTYVWQPSMYVARRPGGSWSLYATPGLILKFS